MNKKQRNILIIVPATLIFIISLLSFLYLNKINFYGDFEIEIYHNEENITDKFNISGTTVFNRSHELTHQKGKVTNIDKWWFKEIHIALNDSCNIATSKIKYSLDKFIIKKDFDTSKKQIILNKGFYSEIFPVKVYKFVKTSRKTNNMFTGLIVSSLAFLVIIITLFVRQKKSLSFTLLGFYVFALIPVYRIFILQSITMSIGIFILISIFFAIISIILVFIKNNSKRNNLITLTGSIFLTIITVEIFLRLVGINKTTYESKLGEYVFIEKQFTNKSAYERTPNSNFVIQSSEFSYSRTTNSLGLSDLEPDLEKKENDFLIIALGDSFTEGDGAHADSTWMKFLERIIPESQHINFRFLNAGICGSDPIYQYKLLEEKLLIYKPDIVITTYGHDMDDVIMRGGIERFENKSLTSPAPRWESIYSVSYIFRLIIHSFMNVNHLFMSTEKYELEKNTALSHFKTNLMMFKKLSENNDFHVLTVFYPAKEEVAQNKFDFWDIIINFAERNNINYLNLLDYYTAEENMTKDNVHYYYWEKDGHHNARGYEVFAKAVYQKLNSLGLLEKETKISNKNN